MNAGSAVTGTKEPELTSPTDAHSHPEVQAALQHIGNTVAVLRRRKVWGRSQVLAAISDARHFLTLDENALEVGERRAEP